MEYSYNDLDSSSITPQLKGQIKIYVNKIPYRTTKGRNAILNAIDPC